MTDSAADTESHNTADLKPTRQTPGTTTDLAPVALRIADFAVAPGLTDCYDKVLINLCGTASTCISSAIEDSTTRFCHHIKHALNADTAYLCNRTSLSIVATSAADSAHHVCEDTQSLHTALTTMVSDLWNCQTPICPPDIRVFADESHFSYFVIPLDTAHDHLLIIVNADTDKSLISSYLADAVSNLYQVFLSTGSTRPDSILPDSKSPDSAQLQCSVLDQLHSVYRISSKQVIQTRLQLFKDQLKQQAVKFSGISLVNRNTLPGTLSTSLPESLYKTAALWNDRFKIALDCHNLVESAYGYKTLCDNEKLLKFSDCRTLALKVHAASLSDPGFIETLQNLIEHAVLHASRLKLDVIPQADTDYTDQLIHLQQTFGITESVDNQDTPPATADHTNSIADEFDLLSVNGITHKLSATNSN